MSFLLGPIWHCSKYMEGAWERMERWSNSCHEQRLWCHHFVTMVFELYLVWTRLADCKYIDRHIACLWFLMEFAKYYIQGLHFPHNFLYLGICSNVVTCLYYYGDAVVILWSIYNLHIWWCCYYIWSGHCLIWIYSYYIWAAYTTYLLLVL